LNFTLPPAGIVGIIGPNGAGKTTLFKMITGKEKPDAGTFSVGETVQIAYVDQEHDDLKPEDSVWQAITGGNELIMIGGKEMNSRAYVSKFNFQWNRSAKESKRTFRRDAQPCSFSHCIETGWKSFIVG
jgi:sulfate-transporting ATPase